MNNKKVEILSPVGSFESLQAAIDAGADAVYFGVEQLNMRTCSSNPILIEDIKEITGICRSHNIKTYLTLNTVMYEHDMQLLKTILHEAKQQNITAVIASDFAVIEMCHTLGIPLHISTQANISNIETVKFYARFSDAVVLARELTLSHVAAICNEIKRKEIRGVSGDILKVEIFGHGALCMAVSGKCYLSLHEQNASANRGACVQNCRRSYTVKDNETGNELKIENEYIMSPKDLCTINFLDEVVNSGIDILKIEGRSKGPDYVYTVTKCYKEALEAIQDGSFSTSKVEAWMLELEKVYNRGFWDGYYLGRKTGEWTKNPGSAATERKIYLGKGSRYYPGIKVGEFLLETGTIKTGDILMITGPHTGVLKKEMNELVVNGAPSATAAKGDKITLSLDRKVTHRDKIYKIVTTQN